MTPRRWPERLRSPAVVWWSAALGLVLVIGVAADLSGARLWTATVSGPYQQPWTGCGTVLHGNEVVLVLHDFGPDTPEGAGLPAADPPAEPTSGHGDEISCAWTARNGPDEVRLTVRLDRHRAAPTGTGPARAQRAHERAVAAADETGREVDGAGATGVLLESGTDGGLARTRARTAAGNVTIELSVHSATADQGTARALMAVRAVIETLAQREESHVGAYR